MATTLSKAVDEATDQVLSIVEQAQEATSSVVQSVSEAVARFVPDLGLGEMVLSPEEAVETSFRVSSRFMDAARSGVLGLLNAVSPITSKVYGKAPAPKAVAKSA
jgi:phage-related protein